jgi:hypothetical protein
MPDQPLRDAFPDWPLPDLERAARAHWDDPGRLRLLLRDLVARPEPAARALQARVEDRLHELPPMAQPRVVRRDPAALRAAPPPPQAPTPEMAAILRLLELERASGETARQEAAELRRNLALARDLRTDRDSRLREELQAAREEARAAREEARRLAQRLATAARPAPAPPARPACDPAYAELGLAPDLPDDLIVVFERALLRHHHPDRAPPDAREAATRRFQSVCVAFQRIRKLRNLPG